MSDWKPFSLILALAFVGCGGTSVQTDTGTASVAKTVLQGIAQSGEPIGAEGNDLREAFEKLKETDAAKGEQLLKELDELSSLNDSAKIRAKASAMAAQL